MFKKKGFTLIELLIVVAIIAILAAIAIPNFLAAQTRAKVSTAMKDMQSIATGIESYDVDNTAYPLSSNYLYSSPPTNGPLDYYRIQRLAQLTTPIAYLTRAPMDVFNINGTITAPWDRAYPYWCPKRFDAYKNSGSYDNMFTDIPDERTRLGGWALMSFGPDQNYTVNVGTWPGKLMPYDPTNGIITNGDIFRFGP